MMKKGLRFYTVSKNPVGYLGAEESFHVEPGKVQGHFHVKARSKLDALRKVTKKNKFNVIGRGVL